MIKSRDKQLTRLEVADVMKRRRLDQALPSARVAGGMNLVYFPQSLARGSEVEILGESDLNRWLKKR